VTRGNKPEVKKVYTIVDMQKVRDQELSHLGQVYYVRQKCGRYKERQSEAECVAEAQGKVLPKDNEP